jgi:hypothetical protein
MCELTTEHFQRVGRMAAAARAHFYIVQTEDLIGRGQIASENIAGAGFAGSENPLEGMENLAGVTGGTRISLSRAGDQSLIAIARATASFYSATIDGREGRPERRDRAVTCITQRPETGRSNGQACDRGGDGQVRHRVSGSANPGRGLCVALQRRRPDAGRGRRRAD